MSPNCTRLALVTLGISAAVIPAASAAWPSLDGPGQPSSAAGGPSPVSSGRVSEERPDPTLLPEKTTATSDTWTLGNGDFRTDIFASAVNYQAETGEWRRINNDLVPVKHHDYALENAANDWRLLIPDDASVTPFQVIGERDSWVQIKMLGLDGAPVDSVWGFPESCERHDFMLRNLYKGEALFNKNLFNHWNKAAADTRFYKDMRNRCEGALDEGWCKNSAWAYYAAVCKWQKSGLNTYKDFVFYFYLP